MCLYIYVCYILSAVVYISLGSYKIIRCILSGLEDSKFLFLRILCTESLLMSRFSMCATFRVSGIFLISYLLSSKNLGTEPISFLFSSENLGKEPISFLFSSENQLKEPISLLFSSENLLKEPISFLFSSENLS